MTKRNTINTKDPADSRTLNGMKANQYPYITFLHPLGFQR